MENSYKTAIARKDLSRPAKMFKPFLFGKVLDFGCGRGTDADILGATKFDPHFFNEKPKKGSFDCVMVTYVLNTVRYPEDVLKMAKEYVMGHGLLLVACRTPKEVYKAAVKGDWETHEDKQGWITGTKTYQRGIHHTEMIKWVGWGDILSQGTKEFSHLIVRKPNG